MQVKNKQTKKPPKVIRVQSYKFEKKQNTARKEMVVARNWGWRQETILGQYFIVGKAQLNKADFKIFKVKTALQCYPCSLKPRYNKRILK